MWEEWRRASGKYSAFVHEKWGSSYSIDISRNLSKFGKLHASENGIGEVVKKMGNKNSSVISESEDEVSGHLIDEKEVLSVLFQQVEDMGSDSEDDDEKDNIYSKLEVRGDRKTEDGQTEDEKTNLSGKEVCGYCERVCFCSPGHRIKRPYFASQKSYTIDVSVPPRYDHYQQNRFCDEAMNSVAKLCTEKLAKHSDSFSVRIVKENYSKRAQQLLGSVAETFELAEEVLGGSMNRKDLVKPVWSEEQAREILSVENIQDQFQAYYSSPYDGEDRQATIEACNSNKHQKKGKNSFMTSEFLENY
jgi:hypothetical protein